MACLPSRNGHHPGDQRELTHSFVATDGGGPNAAQRQELATLIADSRGDALTHVFTTDAFVRGIVTAFRWIARSRAVAHLPGEFAAVCAEAGVKTEDVLTDLVQAQASLTSVRTLQRIVDSVPTARAASGR